MAGFDKAGTDGEQAAFLIVQHSDGDKPFQKMCLPLLQTAVRQGQSKPDEVALLTDRILRGEGRPQIYGTQFVLDKQGRFVLAPTQYPASVDKRRASVGLIPLADYTKMIQQMYPTGPNSDPPKNNP